MNRLLNNLSVNFRARKMIKCVLFFSVFRIYLLQCLQCSLCGYLQDYVRRLCTYNVIVIDFFRPTVVGTMFEKRTFRWRCKEGKCPCNKHNVQRVHCCRLKTIIRSWVYRNMLICVRGWLEITVMIHVLGGVYMFIIWLLLESRDDAH